MKSVLIVHPQIQQLGGAEIVALHIIKRVLDTSDAHVTILSLEPWNISDIFKLTSIALPSERITVVVAKYPKILRGGSGRFYLLRMAFLHRHAKKLAEKFDLCISTFNEIDFMRRGIQYVHCPTFAPVKSLKQYEMIDDSYFLTILKSIIEAPYNIIIHLISGNRKEGIRKNITMTNSQFMAEWLKELYGISSTVVYPETASNSSTMKTIPWEEREFRFVTIGRISPDKKLLEYLGICRAIYKIYPSAKFSIIGRINNTNYYKKIIGKIEKLDLPVELHHGLNNEELLNVLSSSKFYIASKKYEHYGISVLEAVRAGCLVFVHNTGGQREIVNDDRLCYDSTEQLLQQITALIEDATQRENIINKLKTYVNRFNAGNFILGVDRAIRLGKEMIVK